MFNNSLLIPLPNFIIITHNLPELTDYCTFDLIHFIIRSISCTASPHAQGHKLVQMCPPLSPSFIRMRLTTLECMRKPSEIEPLRRMGKKGLVSGTTNALPYMAIVVSFYFGSHSVLFVVQFTIYNKPIKHCID